MGDRFVRGVGDGVGWARPRLGEAGRAPVAESLPLTDRHAPDWPGRLNLTKDNLIGSGQEGSVYRLDAGRCIKIARRRKPLRDEIIAMRQGQPCPHFPRLYAWGPDYIIRQYIDGVRLSQHLDEHGLSREVARQLISIFIWLRRLGFKRIDMRLQHIIYSGARLFIIDPANLNKEDDPFPRKAWKALRKRGLGADFRRYVALLAPALYIEWKRKLD